MGIVKMIGIDTSKHQGSKVNYKKAKECGYGFVILRIGYSKTKDKCFEADYNSAKEAGLKVGVYFYTMSLSTTEAVADATRVLGWLDGRELDLPIFYDLEDSSQKSVNRASVNTMMYLAFKQKIDDDGRYNVGLYTGEYYFNHYFCKTGLEENLWIAKYNSTKPSIGKTVSMWQFTSDYVDGTYYKGKLDRNYMLVDDMPGMKDEQKVTVSGNPYPEPTRNLKKTIPCMRGEDVKWLQFELDITVDGIFGNDTKRAVGEFQKEHGLKVDYIVGSATRYALKNN